ncbi:MAG: AAA family ATPase [Fimbriimonas sp.]
MVILLLNGAFGIGKTTLADAFLRARPDFVVFDPEDVGQALRKELHALQPVDDFQEYPAWVPGVVEEARRLRESGVHLVLPICIADADRFERMVEGLRGVDNEFVALCLVAPPQVVKARLRERGDGEGSWPDVRAETCCSTHLSGTFGIPLDATQTVDALLHQVLDTVGGGRK